VVRIDQPVGTGFSVGTPTATDEQDIADDFVQFLTKFQKLYNIRNFRIFMSGESYAGRYVPYISAAMLDKNDTEHFNLSGKLSAIGSSFRGCFPALKRCLLII
jgi:carboxypeptidase D